MKTPRLTCFAVAASLVACVPAGATTIHVPAQQPTIQAGIDAASHGDTVLVACDTYYEHDIIMKSGVCLRSETGEDNCVTIDAQQQGRGIYCMGVDGTASIVGVTVTGGRTPDEAALEDSVGGGIYCQDSFPTLKNCVAAYNTASLVGGGIFCTNSSPAVVECTFSNNTAAFAGGGLFCYLNADPVLTDCTFVENSSSEGGGMCCMLGCFPTLIGCEFADNTADDGGGMISFMCWPELLGCTFMGNTASFVGGGMTSSESMPTLTDCDFFENSAGEFGGGLRVGQNELAGIAGCRFRDNTAERGGGVGVHSEGNLRLACCTLSRGIDTDAPGSAARGEASFTNCTFARNEASYGGGMFCEDEEDVTLANCTLQRNTASSSGGGLYCEDLATARLVNSIIAFSEGGGAAGGDCGGGVALYCCDVYGNSGGDWVDCIAGQDLINDNFCEDPLFCGPWNLDWPLTLRIDSPCASENNPACGLVGAWDVGCDTAVESASWGSIKAMFR